MTYNHPGYRLFCLRMYISLLLYFFVINVQLQVLFCSTDIGRTSFVRQLESDWHIDSSREITTQLAVCSYLPILMS